MNGTGFKALLCLIGGCLTINAYAQWPTYKYYLEIGKAEFRKPANEQDFSMVLETLEDAVKIEPTEAEGHYYLGYAYDRVNNKEGKNKTPQMSRTMTEKASKEFETVMKLGPISTTDNMVLDASSHITSAWGALALKYYYYNQLDSMMWAFEEGKRRGGFSEFDLQLGKNTLESCKKQLGILLSSSDNLTYPLLYQQLHNKFGTEVTVVDVNLLNNHWYPRVLSEKNGLKFDFNKTALDTVEYCFWEDAPIKIIIEGSGKEFKWVLKPSYYNHYLLRSDRLLVSMLQANKFKRPIYFTTGFSENARLSLNNYITPMLLVEKLNVNNDPTPSYDVYKAQAVSALSVAPLVNKQSPEALKYMEALRFQVIESIQTYLQANDKAKAKELFSIVDKYMPEATFPYSSAVIKNYVAAMRAKTV